MERKLERELERVSGQVDELEACHAQQLRDEHEALLQAALDVQPAPSNSIVHQDSSSLNLGHTPSQPFVHAPSRSLNLPMASLPVIQPLDHSHSQ